MTSSKSRGENDHQLLATDNTSARAQALLRLSAAEAEPSAQLRTRVLNAFEKRMQHKNSAWIWFASATAATVVVVVVLVAFGNWKSRAPQPVPSPMVSGGIPEAPPQAPAGQVLVEPTRPKRAVHTSKQHPLTEALLAKRPAADTDLPIAQFDSLMYCDPFSCGDPMQVIRLQMPASSVGRAYRPFARNGFVNAEVIVGTDGLTRAVRFTR